MRCGTLVVLVALLAAWPTFAVAGTGPDLAPLACPDPDPPLDGAPADVPRGEAPAPVARPDPDGFVTLTLHVEDPQDARGDAYTYRPVHAEGGRESGVFSHRWPTSRDLVTFGAYVVDGDTRVRVPFLVMENVGAREIDAVLLQLARDELVSSPNVAYHALQLVLVGPPNWQAPEVAGYEDRPSVFAWTLYRTTPDGDVWAGFVRTFEADRRDTTWNDRRHEDACRRTQVSAVLRTEAGTEYLGGVYLEDRVEGESPASAESGTAAARETITVGATVRGEDVPLTVLRFEEETRGRRYASQDEHRNEVSLGLVAEGRHRPLIGVRSETTHANPPEAQNRIVSLGVYGRNGDYHPQAGARTHFERYRAEDWVFRWLNTGGPGSAVPGDWEADVGTFDPWGAFVPLVGATYDDTLDEAGRSRATGVVALHEHQALVTLGAWALDEYEPLVGSTYDGETAFLTWAFENVADDWAGMGRWLTSTGAFLPQGAYVPLLGASYAPGDPSGYAVAESYRVGTFMGAYPDFVPLAGADWRAGHTSARWATGYATTLRAPNDARLDAGPVGPDGALVPVVGVTVEAGEADHFGAGLWTPGGFVPIAEACLRYRGQDDVAAGVAVGGGDERTPVASGSHRDGETDAEPFRDCTP